MDGKNIEKNETEARSFRHEDYNNRRVFLRSYPLQWGGGDEENKERAVTKGDNGKKPLRKILSAFHCGGGKFLILRRFRHKVEPYVIACLPVGFKSTTALVSA